MTRLYNLTLLVQPLALIFGAVLVTIGLYYMFGIGAVIFVLGIIIILATLVTS